MLVNAVYYPNWRIYRNEPPSRIKLNIVSHVFYAFSWVKADGTVYLSDEWADLQMDVDGQKGCLRSFTALRRNYSHLKLILSVGGGGAASKPFADVASNRSSRENFARSARRLVDSFAFDGIDVDWEHPSDERQGKDYVSLLKAIRDALPSPQYTVTSALPAGQWALRNIDLKKAQKHLDFINLMTYDFSGPWEPLTGHHAQLFAPRYPYNDASKISGEIAVEYVLSKGVPANKLLLGVPTYGRSFLGTGGVGQKYSGNGGEEGTFEYKDLPQPGTTESVDQSLGAAYCVGGSGGFVSYDNPETVRMKAAFVKDKALGGLFYWTATADSTDNRSLVETGFHALHA